MEAIFSKLNEGGPFFMYPMLFLMILIIILFVRALIDKNKNNKTISLISSIGWFTFAWGFLGQTFGLIDAFDAIEAHGEISPSMVSGGLKMALLTPLFGLFTFLIARLEIIVLVWMKKDEEV
ncbi:MAG: MotA/TolQ/ExbB proton channel family protein [Bacteroidales bacterium]|nr:MotA/TolQ/ExbB proton channel family protein [Bacteroidales bacterium]